MSMECAPEKMGGVSCLHMVTSIIAADSKGKLQNLVKRIW